MPVLEKVFTVVEVDRAEALVGDLFRRRFATDYFPEYPRHFIAFAPEPGGGLLALGYVHYTMWEGCALCGGLVIDERRYRRLPAPARRLIRAGGGVAELLLRHSFARMPHDTIAIWGHVGDRLSARVCARVGFERTADKYVMVAWRDETLAAAERADWVSRVVALGPF